MLLVTAREHHRLATLVASRAATQASNTSSVPDAVRVIQVHQMVNARLAQQAVTAMLAEQDIDTEATAPLSLPGFATDTRSLTEWVDKANGEAGIGLSSLAQSLVQAAGQAAQSVTTAARPAVTGYARYLNPPSCSRCAILAGRIYRYSTGFQRHPLCDCVMQPTNETVGRDLITSPAEAFEKGQIRGLSRADTQAIHDGADLGQVVNIRRAAAGLSESGAVLARAGRLSPEGIYRTASDRSEALALLRRFGYLT